MARRIRLGVPALAALLAVLAISPVDALLAGNKTVHITKFDSSFTGVPGATFTLYEDAPPVGNGPPKGPEDTVVVGSCVTAANGQCDITGVSPGNYQVSETTPPAGYTAAADAAIEVLKKGRVKEVTVYDDKSKPSNRVNDTAGDASVEDGTHISQFGPTVATSPNGREVFIAFNDSPGFFTNGGVSGVGVAFSSNGGRTFEDLGKVPTGSSSTFVLSEPTVTRSPRLSRFIVGFDAIQIDDSGVTRSVMTRTYDPGAGWVGGAVEVFPDIPPDPASAHGPWMFADDSRGSPNYGNIYLAFTHSRGDGQSEGMVARSTDNGKTWKPPVPVTGVGTNDFITGTADRFGYVNVVWTDYGGQSAAVNDFRFARSVDGGKTFGQPVRIAGDVPKSGDLTTCGDATGRTYFGQAHAADAPRIVFNPLDPNRGVVVFTRHGVGLDQSDIVFSHTNDGGNTWTDPYPFLPTSTLPQFYPSAAVTPDGRLTIGYYQPPEVGSSELNVQLAGFDFNFDTIEELIDALKQILIPNEDPFSSPSMNPQYDTAYSSCFGLEPPGIAAPGSGFFAAWTDGRDPGPAANNGVDTNIYFERVEGPFLSTALDVGAIASTSKIDVTGRVTPQPLPGAPVVLTLFVDAGNGFERVDRDRTKTKAGGRFSGAFAGSSGDRCKVVAAFGGSDGRLPSSASTTFAC